MSAQLRLTAYAALATIATATAFISVFKTTAWVVPIMGAIIIVSGSCALVRSSPLPSALEPVVAAIAILFWVTLLFARSKAHLGFIPGRLAIHHLAHTARRGFTQINKLPTPAPPHHGLLLLTVVGVAAVALVVDLLTVTLRRAALSGLPLLALFTVCAATGHHGVGIFPFIIASAGYLWLLFADNREKVARWGAAVGTGSRARPASAWSTDESSAPAPASLGRRVAAMAIGLGVVVPLFIPGLHTGIDKHGTGTGNGSGGGGSQIVVNPIVSVASDLSTSSVIPVISYRTASPDPGYLRLTSLDLFNGSTFSAAQLKAPPSASASEQLPVPAPTAPVQTATISVSPKLSLHWLPAEATTLGVSVDGAWRFDPGTSTIFSASKTTAGLRYTVRSSPETPTPAELNSAGTIAGSTALEADMTVPQSISPDVRRLTKSITAKSTTAYQKALAIQAYFTTGSRFTYDTSIPADNSPNALSDFLFKTRKGFCQQFATAMAVMARLSGIPSRVAVGFTRGKKQSDGSWLVTTHDAHAWPELYFTGYGWLPFEPTPRGDGQAVTPTYAKGTGAGNGGPRVNPTVSPSASTSAGTIPQGLRPKPGVGGGSGSSGTTGAGHSSSVSGQTGLFSLIAALVVLFLLLPGASRAIVRRRRWRHLTEPARAADAAWAELRDTAIDLRVPWDDGHTPRQVAVAALAALRANSDTTAAMRRLAQHEERSRYAPRSESSGIDLRRDVMVVRTAALARRTRFQRVIARLVPRSTLQVVRAALGHLWSVFDVFDRISVRARRALRSRSWLRSGPAHAHN
jgi:transglutaminase-like putative cysteine protease